VTRINGLTKLPGEPGAAVLARLELAAGKLPTAGHVLAGRTLGDEHAIRGVDEHARDDVDR
jgi:hypothetical protein